MTILLNLRHGYEDLLRIGDGIFPCLLCRFEVLNVRFCLLACSGADPSLVSFKSFYDGCLVWPSEIQRDHLPLAITVSWGIALIEYCFAVPANRIGFGTYSAAELKTIQEVITLVVFAGFSVLVLGEALNWGHGVGFALIALGATFIFQAK